MTSYKYYLSIHQRTVLAELVAGVPRVVHAFQYGPDGYSPGSSENAGARRTINSLVKLGLAYLTIAINGEMTAKPTALGVETIKDCSRYNRETGWVKHYRIAKFIMKERRKSDQPTSQLEGGPVET